jgi:hypothetical protein
MKFSIYRKYFFILLFILLVVISLLLFLNSRQSLIVLYDSSKIKNVLIYEDYISNGDTVPKNSKPVAEIKNSGDTITLTKKKYIIKYTASSGYSNPYKYINLNGKPIKYKIEVFYNENRLRDLLNVELPIIKSVIVKKYLDNKIGQYNILDGKLYEDGSWYGTLLQYKGDDINNANTLRIILHKENGVWVIKTDPPNITLSSLRYKNIPYNILDDVNNTQQVPLLDKFLNKDNGINS